MLEKTEFNFRKEFPMMAFTYENQLWQTSIWFKLKFPMNFSMSAINRDSKKSSDKKSLLIVSGILSAIGIALFAYLMFYTTPEEVMERVEIIAVTENGCIAETIDGFAVNIGDCVAQEGDFVVAPVDQKVNDRAAALNPTN